MRVETDWYAQHTEFRYVLEPGQGMPRAHGLPIGQVMFVPREEVSLRDATEAGIEEVDASRDEFNEKKAAEKTTTRYGQDARLSPR